MTARDDVDDWNQFTLDCWHWKLSTAQYYLPQTTLLCFAFLCFASRTLPEWMPLLDGSASPPSPVVALDSRDSSQSV